MEFHSSGRFSRLCPSSKIEKLKPLIKKWNKEFFKSLEVKKENCLTKIAQLDEEE